MFHHRTSIAVGAIVVLLVGANAMRAESKIGSFVRVKGQEENRLHGMGIVVGLKSGNGDSDATPTLRHLAQMAKRLNNSIGTGAKGLDDLKTYKNVALVTVTARVPAQGAREGDLLDCQVQALGAKSLQGGTLLFASLVSGNIEDDRVYAIAEGALVVPQNNPTTARIERGAQLIVNFYNRFAVDGKISLVVKEAHASFAMAQEIAMQINEDREFQDVIESTGQKVAQALDARNVIVRIPTKYAKSPVALVSYVLGLRVVQPPKVARVLIREKDGLIIIDPNVAIVPVLITHKSLSISPDGGTPIGQFVKVDPEEKENSTKLQALVDALKSLKVPTNDIIAIIKGIHANGGLYGKLVIEP